MGKHKVNSYFHFSPCDSFDKNKNQSYFINNENYHLIFTSNVFEKDELHTSTISPSYGVSIPSTSIYFQQREQLPLENRYYFTLLNS